VSKFVSLLVTIARVLNKTSKTTSPEKDRQKAYEGQGYGQV